MKTFKYLSLLFLISSTLFVSCKKEESKDVSEITEPAVITMNGDALVFRGTGIPYTDPGAVVAGGTLINTINTVDTRFPGSYTVKYIAKNNVGALVTAVRKVIVLEAGDGSLDLSGDYIGGRGTTVGGAVTLTKVGTGVYLVSDYFGEYYEIYRGYGSFYTAPGVLTYKGNNTAIMPVVTSTPWGDVDFQGGTASIGIGSNGKISINYALVFSDGSGFPAPFFLNKQ